MPGKVDESLLSFCVCTRFLFGFLLAEDDDSPTLYDFSGLMGPMEIGVV